MSTKYKDEGDLFWTFFSYVSKCFAPHKSALMGNNSTEAQSFENCYDWSTVMIQENEEEIGFIDDDENENKDDRNNASTFLFSNQRLKLYQMLR